MEGQGVGRGEVLQGGAGGRRQVLFPVLGEPPLFVGRLFAVLVVQEERIPAVEPHVFEGGEDFGDVPVEPIYAGENGLVGVFRFLRQKGGVRPAGLRIGAPGGGGCAASRTTAALVSGGGADERRRRGRPPGSRGASIPPCPHSTRLRVCSGSARRAARFRPRPRRSAASDNAGRTPRPTRAADRRTRPWRHGRRPRRSRRRAGPLCRPGRRGGGGAYADTGQTFPRRTPLPRRTPARIRRGPTGRRRRSPGEVCSYRSSFSAGTGAWERTNGLRNGKTGCVVWIIQGAEDCVGKRRFLAAGRC